MRNVRLSLGPTGLRVFGNECFQCRCVVPRIVSKTEGVRDRDDWIGFELGGERALRRGHWKAVWMRPPLGAGDWRLYRLDRDPSELHDRNEEEPEKLAELIDLWHEYARHHNVVVAGDDASSSARAEAR